MKKPCLARNCPELVDRGPRCPAHAKEYEWSRRPSSTERYGPAFGRRHKEAVLAEPWCHSEPCPWDDAATPANPLTADHLTPAIHGGAAGPLGVLCRRCNSARGARRWT